MVRGKGVEAARSPGRRTVRASTHPTRFARSFGRPLSSDVSDIQMRRIIPIALVLVALGCERRKTPAVATQPAYPKSIGPQFWKYDLSEYERVEHDVVYGLGGRWISVRYKRKAEAAVTRDEMASAIRSALQEDGWSSKPLPTYKYVLSKIWQTSPSDLCFARAARADDPENSFFTQVIHISQDGKTLCVYAEVAW